MKFCYKRKQPRIAYGDRTGKHGKPDEQKCESIIASPIFCALSFFSAVSKKPNPKIGIANVAILKLKPNNATIHAVIVVPIFAPKMTPTDCVSVMSPAFTNETIMTVVAPDD